MRSRFVSVASTRGPLEIRRQIGEEEGFVFDDPGTPWEESASDEGAQRIGLTLDWPGITRAGSVRQDWGRTLGGRPIAAGWIHRRGLSGSYATLSAEGPGPVANTEYQRLFIWSLAGRYRLRCGPILELQEGSRIVIGQPIVDTESLERNACSSTRSRSGNR